MNWYPVAFLTAARVIEWGMACDKCPCLDLNQGCRGYIHPQQPRFFHFLFFFQFLFCGSMVIMLYLQKEIIAIPQSTFWHLRTSKPVAGNVPSGTRWLVYCVLYRRIFLTRHVAWTPLETERSTLVGFIPENFFHFMTFFWSLALNQWPLNGQHFLWWQKTCRVNLISRHSFFQYSLR